MGATLTIRLSDKARKILETAARAKGTGLSAFVRQIAETEAIRLRNAEIRGAGQEYLEELAKHPEARKELDLYTSPGWDGLPDEDWSDWKMLFEPPK